MKAGETIRDGKGRTWSVVEFQKMELQSFLEGVGTIPAEVGEQVRTPVVAVVLRLESEGPKADAPREKSIVGPVTLSAKEQARRVNSMIKRALDDPRAPWELKP